MASVMELEVVAADIGSAYIQAYTKEKIYTIEGPEWKTIGLEGAILIMEKALYGLKSSGAMWHQKLAASLRDVGFVPCQADHDMWMRKMNDHYEYTGVIVDDLLVFSRNAGDILNPLWVIYKFVLKGVGSPEYYNGADMRFTTDGYAIISAKTYIKNVTCLLYTSPSPRDA